jgi:2,3,4,5-tetrahydropyridine-2,6-dicarboxylate N-succinyltransferase
MSGELAALRGRIEELWSAGEGAEPAEAREAFGDLRGALSRGEARAAEPDPGSPTGWRVNLWVKQGILLGFRHGNLTDASMDHGRLPFFDKDTLPLKELDLSSGVRVVPGGSAVRDGAFVGRGVICMPPMYINVGAFVDEGTMVDSHALVGSCAQVGKRVHVSAAAQIGGVLEPIGAMPVIVEDDVLIGGNTGLYEGAVVKRRAVVGAGTVLTGSTPVYDLPGGRILRPEPGVPLVVPEGAVVVPGARAVTLRRPHRARDVAEMSLLDLARTLIDIDSTTGREAEACRWLADHLRARGYAVTEQTVEVGRNNILAFVDPKPEIVLSTHVDCVPPFFPSRVGGGRLHGRGACDAKGSIAAQVTAVERLRAEGEGRVGLLFVVGEERGSDGAAAADDLAPGSRFLIDGEPTDNRLGQATRGVLRLRLRATGRAAHSSQPERGVSAIDALVDALVELRRLPLPEDPDLGSTFYTVGLISGGIAPNVVSPTAEAELNFRTVGPGADVVESLAPLRPRVSIEHILEVPPVRLHTVPGFESAVFAFTTDIPLLPRWGRPLLFGPGSIVLAHTDEESVEITELEAAADGYVRVAKGLLADGA